MKQKTTCLILGACIALQVPVHTASSQHLMMGEEPMSLPAHRFLHLNSFVNSESATPAAYGEFVLEAVEQSLPEKYQNQSRRVAQAIIDEANYHGLDPLLIVAVATQESRFNPEARGRHGEIGLMQIKPSTARWLALKAGSKTLTEEKAQKLLLDPVFNIRAGAAYLAVLKDSFKGASRLYVSAYNMGPGNVRLRLKEQVHPRVYADQVFEKYQTLAREFMRETSSDYERQVAASELELSEEVTSGL